jgi:hypothetical protein
VPVEILSCDYPLDVNPRREAVEFEFRQFVERAGFVDADLKAVSGASNIVGAAAIVYPFTDVPTLLGASLWTAFLIVNDDRWDCATSARDDAVAGVPPWFAELRQVLDDREVDRRGADPLALFLSFTLDELERTLGAPALAELTREIRTTLDAMVWEHTWGSYTHAVSMATYLSFRRAFCTMNVQLVLDKWVNGGHSFAELADHPVRVAIDEAVVRFGCLSNDYYSWEREKRAVDTSNAVRVQMDHEGLSEEAAVAAVRGLCDQALRDLACLDEVLSLADAGDERTRLLREYLNSHKPLISAAARWPALTDRYTVT